MDENARPDCPEVYVMEGNVAEKGYNVSLIKDDIYAIREMAANTQAFILYLQDSIVGDMDLTKSVLLLCDTFQDLNRNMILIGSETCKDALLGNIPGTWGTNSRRTGFFQDS